MVVVFFHFRHHIGPIAEGKHVVFLFLHFFGLGIVVRRRKVLTKRPHFIATFFRKGDLQTDFERFVHDLVRCFAVSQLSLEKKLSTSTNIVQFQSLNLD